MQATTPKLFGVDLSHANVDVDLHGLVAAGSLTFIGLKATEGSNFVDPTFADRFRRITEYLPSTYVLAYHFLRIDSSPADQMRHFHDVLTKVGYFDHDKALAPAIDAERGLQGQEPSGTQVTAAVNVLTSLSGHKPGIYSGLDYWRTHLAGVDCAYKWVARYSSTPPSIAYDIWQDSESRVIAGHAYDHNVFIGDEARLVAKCGRH
jgi:lysozyme